MKLLHNIDWAIILPGITIFLLGVTILLSIAPGLFWNQVFFGILALFLFVIFSQIDFRIYKSFAIPFYLLSIIFLLLTFLLGVATRGSVRWIDLGIIKIQPSEIIKPMMIVFVASFFSKENLSLQSFLKYLFLFLIPVGLILKQPDLGSAIVFVTFGLVILIMSGYKPKITALFSVFTLIVAPFFWHFLKDYQKQRIISFLDPSADPLGIGYNVIQAMVAVGSGGVFGRGLGRGTQSHLQFLPEYQTDFIFASYSEEFGLVGGILLIILYFLILSKILKISGNVHDRFGEMLCFGVFSVIFIQAIVNIGMNMGLLPITGITLPLVSYGGSSLISFAVLLGIVSNIASNKQNTQKFITIR